MRTKALCLLLIISAGRCAASGAASPQASRMEAATVSAALPTVAVLHEGEVRPSPLKPHDTVSVGDVIRTEKNGRAEISFPNILTKPARQSFKALWYC